jgi:hypothetical protein
MNTEHVIDPNKIMGALARWDYFGMVPAKIYAMLQAASEYAKVHPKQCDVCLKSEPNGYSIQIEYRFSNELQR